MQEPGWWPVGQARSPQPCVTLEALVAFSPQCGGMKEGHAFTNPHGKEKTGAVCYSQLVFFSSNSLS